MYPSGLSPYSSNIDLHSFYNSSSLVLEKERTFSSSSTPVVDRSEERMIKKKDLNTSEKKIKKSMDSMATDPLLDRCVNLHICDFRGGVLNDSSVPSIYRLADIPGNGFQNMCSNIEKALYFPQIAILPFYERGTHFLLKTLYISYTRIEVLQFLMRQREELGIVDIQFVGSFCFQEIIDKEILDACVYKVMQGKISEEEIKQKDYFLGCKPPGDCDIRITTLKNPALITENILSFFSKKISKKDQNELQDCGLNPLRAAFQAQLKSKKIVVSEENTFAMVGFLSPCDSIPTEFICVKNSKKSHRLTQDCFKVSIFHFLLNNNFSELSIDAAPFGSQAFFDLFFCSITPSAYDPENWSRALFLNKRFLNELHEKGLVESVLHELEPLQDDQEKADHLFSIVKKDLEKIPSLTEKLNFSFSVMQSVASYSPSSTCFFSLFLQKILAGVEREESSHCTHLLIDLLLKKQLSYDVIVSYLSLIHLSQSSSVIKWGNGYAFQGDFPFSHSLKIDLETQLETIYSYFSEESISPVFMNSFSFRERFSERLDSQHNGIPLLKIGRIGSLDRSIVYLQKLIEPHIPLKAQALALSILLDLDHCPDKIYYFSSLLEFFPSKRGKKLLHRLCRLVASRPDLNPSDFFSQISLEGPYGVSLWINHHYFNGTVLKEEEEKKILQIITHHFLSLPLEQQTSTLSGWINESLEVNQDLEASPLFFIRLFFSLYSHGTFSEEFFADLITSSQDPFSRLLIQKKIPLKLGFELLSFFYFTESLCTSPMQMRKNVFSLASTFLSSSDPLKQIECRFSSYEVEWMEQLKAWSMDTKIPSSENGSAIALEKKAEWISGLSSLVSPHYPLSVRTSAFKALIYLEEIIPSDAIPYFLDVLGAFPEVEQKILTEMAIETAQKNSWVEEHSFLRSLAATSDLPLSLIKTGKKEWIDWVLQHHPSVDHLLLAFEEKMRVSPYGALSIFLQLDHSKGSYLNELTSLLHLLAVEHIPSIELFSLHTIIKEYAKKGAFPFSMEKGEIWIQTLLNGVEPSLGEELLFLFPIERSLESRLLTLRFVDLKKNRGETSPSLFKNFFWKVFIEKRDQEEVLKGFFLDFLQEPLHQKDLHLCESLEGKPFNPLYYKNIKVSADFPSLEWIKWGDYLNQQISVRDIKEWLFFWRTLNQLKIEKEGFSSLFSLIEKTENLTASFFKEKKSDPDYKEIAALVQSIQSKIPLDLDTISDHVFFVRHLIQCDKFGSIEQILSETMLSQREFFPENYFKVRRVLRLLDEVALMEPLLDHSHLKAKVNHKIFSKLFDTKILNQEQLIAFIKEMNQMITENEQSLDLDLLKKFFLFIFSNKIVDEEFFLYNFNRLIFTYDKLIDHSIEIEKKFIQHIHLEPGQKSRLCYHILKQRISSPACINYKIDSFISLSLFLSEEFYLNEILEDLGLLIGELLLENKQENGFFEEKLTEIISSLNFKFSPKSYTLFFSAISSVVQNDFLAVFVFSFCILRIREIIHNINLINKIKRKENKREKGIEIEKSVSVILNLLISFVAIKGKSTLTHFEDLINTLKISQLFTFVFGTHRSLFSSNFYASAEVIGVILDPAFFKSKKKFPESKKKQVNEKFKEWGLSPYHHKFYLEFFSSEKKDFVYLDDLLQFLFNNFSSDAFLFSQKYISYILNSSVLKENEKIEIILNLKNFFLMSFISSKKEVNGWDLEEKQLKFYFLFLKSLSFLDFSGETMARVRKNLIEEILLLFSLEVPVSKEAFIADSHFQDTVDKQMKILNYYYEIFKDKEFIANDFAGLLGQWIENKEKTYSFNVVLTIFFNLINKNTREFDYRFYPAKSLYLSFIDNYLMKSKETLDVEKDQQEIILIELLLTNKDRRNQDYFLDRWEMLFQKLQQVGKKEIEKTIPFHIFSIWIQDQIKKEIDDFSDRKKSAFFETLNSYFDYFNASSSYEDNQQVVVHPTFFYSDAAFCLIFSLLDEIFCCRKLEAVHKLDYVKKIYFSFKNKGYEHFFIRKGGPINYDYLIANLPPGSLEIQQDQEQNLVCSNPELSVVDALNSVLKEFNRGINAHVQDPLNQSIEDLSQFFSVCKKFLENKELWEHRQFLFYSWLQQLRGKSVPSKIISSVSAIFLIQNLENYKEKKINFEVLSSSYYCYLNLIESNDCFLEKINTMFGEVFAQRILENNSAQEFISVLSWELIDLQKEDLYKQSIFSGLMKLNNKKAAERLIIELCLYIDQLYKEENSVKKILKIFHYLTYIGSDFSLKFASQNFQKGQKNCFLEKAKQISFHNSLVIDFIEMQLFPVSPYRRNLLDFLPFIQHYVIRKHISLPNLKFITKIICDCFNQNIHQQQDLSEIFEHFDSLIYQFCIGNPSQQELSNGLSYVCETLEKQIKNKKIVYKVFLSIQSQIFYLLNGMSSQTSDPFQKIVYIFFYLRFARKMVRDFDLTHYLDVDTMNTLPFLKEIFIEIKTKGLEESLFITIMKEIFGAVDEFYQLSKILSSNEEKLNEIALISCNKAVEIVSYLEEGTGDFRMDLVQMLFNILQDPNNLYHSFDFSSPILPLKDFFEKRGLSQKI